MMHNGHGTIVMHTGHDKPTMLNNGHCTRLTMHDRRCRPITMEDGRCTRLAMHDRRCRPITMEDGRCTRLAMDDGRCRPIFMHGGRYALIKMNNRLKDSVLRNRRDGSMMPNQRCCPMAGDNRGGGLISMRHRRSKMLIPHHGRGRTLIPYHRRSKTLIPHNRRSRRRTMEHRCCGFTNDDGSTGRSTGRLCSVDAILRSR
jgi:hypothetical protein